MQYLKMGISSLHLGDFPSVKIKVDQFLIEWLETEGRHTINIIASQKSPTKSLHMEQSSSFPSKKSPKKRTQSEMLNTRTSKSDEAERLGVMDKPLSFNIEEDIDNNLHISTSRRRSNFDTIPRFFIRGQNSRSAAQRVEEDQLAKRLPEIEAFFKPYPSGIPVEKFVHITKRLCGIPSFFNLPLCKRIHELYGSEDSATIGRPVAGVKQPLPAKLGAPSSNIVIKLKAFLQFWHNEIEPFSRQERFFRIIKQPSADTICKDDFVPFIQELLHFHPGLDFLEAHEEFQRKYALTVITRIFYKVNASRTGRISLREVRDSNLMAEFMHADEETDINRVTEYFSYEHFYVLYCRFFELDADRDSKLTRLDLSRYGDGCLSEAILDRVFHTGCRVFSDGREGGFGSAAAGGGMLYPDFVFFMLAEEDRSTPAALRYWFACCDLDGDGRLTPEELLAFYRGQLARVAAVGQEPVHFRDVLCQMVDLIFPADCAAITLQDLCRPERRHVSGLLFDVLFNVHKFLRFESRDPFQEKQRREDGFGSDWDRFAHWEYLRLASEEDNDDDFEQELLEDSGASGRSGCGMVVEEAEAQRAAAGGTVKQAQQTSKSQSTSKQTTKKR